MATKTASNCSLHYTEETHNLSKVSGIPVLTDMEPGVSVYKSNNDGSVVLGLYKPDQPPTALLDAFVGKLHCQAFMALARVKLYWMCPFFSQPNAQPCATQLPVETQMLLLHHHHYNTSSSDSPLEEEDLYTIMLPLIDWSSTNGFRCSLRPPSPPTFWSSFITGSHKSQEERMVIRIESGDPSVCSNSWKSILYVATGTDPYRLIDSGVTAAAAISGIARPRCDKEVPAILDTFCWCSWDSFYADVSPQGLQEGLKAFAAGGITVPTVIIDDGWQCTNVDKEYSNEAPDHLYGSMRSMSLERLASRRLSAELLFQDLQVTEPLRYLENKKREEELLTKSSSRKSFTIARQVFNTVSSRIQTTIGMSEGYLVRFLQQMLQDLPSGSNTIEILAYLASGPLRRAILRFYAKASGHSRRLVSVRANSKFDTIDSGPDHPLTVGTENFGSVCSQLKKEYNVHYIVCWHAMAGYWSGVMPDAPETARFNSQIKHPKPSSGTLEVDMSMKWAHPALAGVGLPANPRELHAAMHEYLQDCGIDGVKVDVQATVSMFGFDCGGYATTSRKYHESLEESVHQHLPGNIQINSMCCSIEDVYNMKYSNIARVGEDFYPTLPASHTAHIANASFTTLMLGAIAFADWDMFHSNHPSKYLHAAARCISGGLVYVSDRVGDHDFDLLKRIVLPDGSIPRCLYPARPTVDCLFKDASRDGKTALKVWNMNPVTGIVAAFNVQGSTWAMKQRNYKQHDSKPADVVAVVKPRDCAQLGSSSVDQYAVYSDSRKILTLLSSGDQGFNVVLKGGGGHELFVISPVNQLTNGVLFAPIGLVNMMNSGGAVMTLDVVDGFKIALKVKGVGEFVSYCSVQPTLVSIDGKAVTAAVYSSDNNSLRFDLPMPEDVTMLVRDVLIVF